MTNNTDELFYHYNGDDWRLFDPDTGNVTNITIKTIKPNQSTFNQTDFYKDMNRNLFI